MKARRKFYSMVLTVEVNADPYLNASNNKHGT